MKIKMLAMFDTFPFPFRGYVIEKFGPSWYSPAFEAWKRRYFSSGSFFLCKATYAVHITFFDSRSSVLSWFTSMCRPCVWALTQPSFLVQEVMSEHAWLDYLQCFQLSSSIISKNHLSQGFNKQVEHFFLLAVQKRTSSRSLELL